MKFYSSLPSRSWLSVPIGVIVLLFFMLGCQGQTDTGETAGEQAQAGNNSLAFANETIMDVVRSDARFSTFSAAIDSAGLTSALREDGPYTVFAPTNEAFDALPAGTLDELWQDDAYLQEVLAYHIGDGRYRLNDLHGTDALTTLSGASIAVRSDESSVMVDDAIILEADVLSNNGLLHVVDAVLFPPDE